MNEIANPYSQTQPVFPWVRCPVCSTSFVGVQSTVEVGRNREIELAIRYGKASPIDDHGTYLAWVDCPRCKEQVAAAGDWETDVDFGDEGQQTYASLYHPRWLSHPPQLVQKTRAPKKVLEELQRASRLFWADLTGCQTALRRVVEVFLDAQHVPRRRTRGRGGKFIPLSERIGRFVQGKPAARGPEYEKFLHAIREAANEGVHNQEVVIDDVRLVVEWIRRVLDLRYPEPDPVLREAVRRSRRRRSQSAVRPNPVPSSKSSSVP